MKSEWIDRYVMLPAGTHVLCAVSGGADSVFLLHQLKAMEKERGLQISVAHFDHGLRGIESDRDSQFTQQQCDALNVPCVVGHITGSGWKKPPGRFATASWMRRRIACTVTGSRQRILRTTMPKLS